MSVISSWRCSPNFEDFTHHSVLSSAIWSATSDCLELPGSGKAPPRPTIQACSMAFYCLVSQVSGQFPFILLSQKSCFFLWKSPRTKSKTSPASTGRLGPKCFLSQPCSLSQIQASLKFLPPSIFRSWKPSVLFSGITLCVLLLDCKSPSCWIIMCLSLLSL